MAAASGVAEDTVWPQVLAPDGRVGWISSSSSCRGPGLAGEVAEEGRSLGARPYAPTLVAGSETSPSEPCDLL